MIYYVPTQFFAPNPILLFHFLYYVRCDIRTVGKKITQHFDHLPINRVLVSFMDIVDLGHHVIRCHVIGGWWSVVEHVGSVVHVGGVVTHSLDWSVAGVRVVHGPRCGGIHVWMEAVVVL